MRKDYTEYTCDLSSCGRLEQTEWGDFPSGWVALQVQGSSVAKDVVFCRESHAQEFLQQREEKFASGVLPPLGGPSTH
jgi:hypothetical protein